jgi:2-iminobutanoate/2-iminopropanoate deaminase
MKVIKTENAPQAIGIYSQGIGYADFVFTSGQIPLSPKTGKLVEGDFKAEVMQVLENLSGVLEAGNSSLEKVLKFTVYLTDLKNFSLLNEVFADYFKSNPPARSAVEVSALPMGARVEIEAVGSMK